MPSLEWYIHIFVSSRMSPEDMKKQLLEGGLDSEEVERAYREFRRRTAGKRYLTPPPMLVDEQAAADSWYMGADEIANARFWPALKTYLEWDKGWPSEAVASLHHASDKIVSWLASPAAAAIKTRGLVVGYVQSGKTANFTAVISKAADAGYRFFIILSGTKNSLRRQTQQRLNREIIDLNPENWYSITTAERDFLANSNIGNATYFLANNPDQKVMCVVKKNATILKRLTSWLKSASPEVLRSCPFLVIDDEADEASVNTAPGQAYSDPEDADRSKINKRLVELLGLLPKAAYVGYTATPFANVLIDPSFEGDLYPRDFIVSLPKPEGHFGTEEIFGRERLLEDETDDIFAGLDVVRIVPEDEVKYLRPASRTSTDFEFAVTPSLERAIQYFWMATAARCYRGQGAEHSTMLVHTSERIAVHNSTQRTLESFRRRFLARLSGNESETTALLQAQWNSEMSRTAALEGANQTQPVSFRSLLPYLYSIVDKTIVVADNSQSPQRLSYDESGRIQIAVGGNTLARGLTLEGLVVSYFVRTASAYDTLLQMGRWFGYRPGYGDLPRIWMTQELKDYFYDLATIEAEVRSDIEQYALTGLTPRNFGVRIRQHPELNITAALKMQHAAAAEVSFGSRKHQTVLFYHKDKSWLDTNIEATAELLARLKQDVGHPQSVNGHEVFYDVQVSHILQYFEHYQFHEGSNPLNARLLRGYIRDQNSYGALRTWNVAVRGLRAKAASERAQITLGPLTVPLLERARRKEPTEHANIGVLMSRGDIAIDLPVDEFAASSEPQLISKRRQLLPETGLLVIYPISKDSQPGRTSGSSGDRVPLDAAENLIGLGLVFPDAHPGSRSEQTYVTVDPTKLLGEDIDFVEEDLGDE